MDLGSPLQSPIRSRSRSGSRSGRRHRSPRSPPIGPGGDSGRGGARYYEDQVYSRAPNAYTDREARYSSDYRMMDPYARGAGGGPMMGSGGPGSRRSRSRSPMSSRRRGGGQHEGDRENPPPCKCIGIFGLSIYTKESDILDVFSRYGPIDDVQIVYDVQSGRSRGFAFVYFQNLADASEARERCNGIDIDGRKIRVDFSLSKKAHSPTPGFYVGHLNRNPSRSHGGSGGGGGGGGGGGYYGGSHGYNGGGYPPHRSNRMHNPYPSRGGRHYPPHAPALPPVDYGRRRATRSRSASPRKYYY